MASWSKTSTSSQSSTTSQKHTDSLSATSKVLNEQLLETILGGLTDRMSREEIQAYAADLLRPQLSAALEAAQHQYETTALSKRQEIDNLAAQLARAIGEQHSAYQKSMAQVETAALARGMGRSSYTLEALSDQGDALANAVQMLTQENERKSAQLQSQITQAAQQNAAAQGRLNADYEKALAAKILEIEQAQRKEMNSNYLTAVSAAMGSQTTGSSDTTSQSHTSSSSTRTTTSGRSGSSSSGKKTQEETVDAVSSAAPSVRAMTGG